MKKALGTLQVRVFACCFLFAYYTMEVLVGESLADRLAKADHLPLGETVHIFIQVCQALSAAHHKGILHRDLKPGNIFLESGTTGDRRFPNVKIVDFGLAGWALQSAESQRLTATGTVFGSPLYMSPEQSLGQEMSQCSDIYSCGCALYETLTGLPPYFGENSFVTMLQHQSKPVPVLHSPRGGEEFPDCLQELLQNMLAKKPARRTESFEQVAGQLKAALDASRMVASSDLDPDISGMRSLNSRRRARRPAVIALAAAALAGAAALSMAGLGGRPFLDRGKHDPDHDKAVSALASAPPVVRRAPQASTGNPKFVLAPSQRYYRGQSKERPGWLLYRFPEVSLGKLGWGPANINYLENNRPSKNLQAQNDVLVAPDALLHITPSLELISHPQWFDGFAPDELAQIIISPYQADWGDAQVKRINRLTGLLELSMDNSSITDKCLDDLNKLISLRSLSVKNTALSAEALARLKRLPKLDTLRADGLKNISLVLQKMQADSAIQQLQLTNCNLSRPEIELIVTMPSITELYLTGNSQVDDGCVELLRKLKHLRELHLGGATLSARSIEQFKKFPHLKQLFVSSSTWDPADYLSLRTRLPGLAIGEEKTAGKNADLKRAESFLQDLR